MAGDINAPGAHRADTVHYVEAWPCANDVKPGDRLCLDPTQRAQIW